MGDPQLTALAKAYEDSRFPNALLLFLKRRSGDVLRVESDPLLLPTNATGKKPPQQPTTSQVPLCKTGIYFLLPELVGYKNTPSPIRPLPFKSGKTTINKAKLPVSAKSETASNIYEEISPIKPHLSKVAPSKSKLPSKTHKLAQATGSDNDVYEVPKNIVTKNVRTPVPSRPNKPTKLVQTKLDDDNEVPKKVPPVPARPPNFTKTLSKTKKLPPPIPARPSKFAETPNESLLSPPLPPTSSKTLNQIKKAPPPVPARSPQSTKAPTNQIKKAPPPVPARSPQSTKAPANQIKKAPPPVPARSPQLAKTPNQSEKPLPPPTRSPHSTDAPHQEEQALPPPPVPAKSPQLEKNSKAPAVIKKAAPKAPPKYIPKMAKAGDKRLPSNFVADTTIKAPPLPPKKMGPPTTMQKSSAPRQNQ